MAVTAADIKFYLADGNGNIDLNTELDSLYSIFADVLDIGNDVEKKFFVKNINVVDDATIGKFYIINGVAVTNTTNTPVITASTKIYEDIPLVGDYSLTFPTVNSVIVTPPGGQARAAQTIVCDGSTSNPVLLQDGKPVYLTFSASLTTGDTATVKISDGGKYIQLSEDSGNAPVSYSVKNSYSSGIDIGTLAAEGTHPIWVKQVVPDGIGSASNPRLIAPTFRFTG